MKTKVSLIFIVITLLFVNLSILTYAENVTDFTFKASDLIPNTLNEQQEYDLKHEINEDTGDILYPVWVSGVQVTGTSDATKPIAVVDGDKIEGSVIYVPSVSGSVPKLILTNATIKGFNVQVETNQAPGYELKTKAAISSTGPLEIELVGTNTIDGVSLGIETQINDYYLVSAGIFGEILTFSGDGTLDVKSGNITGSEVKVNIFGREFSLYQSSIGILAGNMELNDNVTINASTTNNIIGVTKEGINLQGVNVTNLVTNAGTLNTYGSATSISTGSTSYSSIGLAVLTAMQMDGGTVNAYGRTNADKTNSIGLMLNPNSTLTVNDGTLNAVSGVLSTGGNSNQILNSYAILSSGIINVNGGVLNATANGAQLQSVGISSSTGTLNVTGGDVIINGGNTTTLTLNSTQNIRLLSGITESTATEIIEPESTTISSPYIKIDFVNAYPIWIAGERVVTELDQYGTISISNDGITGVVQYNPATINTTAQLTIISSTFSDGLLDGTKKTAIYAQQDLTVNIIGNNQITTSAFTGADQAMGFDVGSNALVFKGTGNLQITLPSSSSSGSKSITGAVTLESPQKLFAGTSHADAEMIDYSELSAGVIYTELRPVLSSITGTITAYNDDVELNVELYMGDKLVKTISPTPVANGNTLTYDFNFELLEEGTYSFNVVKQGFLKYTITDISLNGINTVDLTDVHPITLIPGDINGDDEISVADIVEAAKSYNGTSSQSNPLAADINGDGKVNFVDITMIRNINLLGKTTADCTVSYISII